MTKQEFFSLNYTKTTMDKLRALSIKLLGQNNLDYKFYSEIVRNMQTYLQLDARVKKIVSKPTLEKSYNMYVEIIKLGYRKDLVLPF